MVLSLAARSNPLSVMGRRRQRPGAAAVELAVLLPFLAFIFLITFDVARLLYYTITIDNCAYNAALFASQTFDNQNQQWIGNDQYWEGPNGQSNSTAAAAAVLDGANLSPALATSNVSIASGTDSLGNSVNNITITYTFFPLTPFPGIPASITITRTLQARIAPATPSS